MNDNVETLLTDAEADALIAWMRSVRHVERNQAVDLRNQGRLTRLHAAYFRAAECGVSLNSYRRARGL